MLVGPPPGAVFQFAGAIAPQGYLLCDGSLVSRTTYADLFAAISTQYGVGDGVNTFGLPDGKGRGLVGQGTHADVGTLGNNEGLAVGSRRMRHKHIMNDTGHVHTMNDPGHNHALTDPGHNHPITDTGHVHNVLDPGHTHYVYGYKAPPTAAAGTDEYTWGTPGGNPATTDNGSPRTTGITLGATVTGITVNNRTTGITLATVSSGISANSATTGITVGPQTGNEPTDSAAYLVVTHIIKY